jgi:hypothetical protein
MGVRDRPLVLQSQWHKYQQPPFTWCPNKHLNVIFHLHLRLKVGRFSLPAVTAIKLNVDCIEYYHPTEWQAHSHCLIEVKWLQLLLCSSVPGSNSAPRNVIPRTNLSLMQMLPLHTVIGNMRILSQRHSRHLHNYPPIWVYGTLPIQCTKVNLKNLQLCLSTTLWRRIWNEARCVPHVCTRHNVKNLVSLPLVICGPISIRTCHGCEKFLLLCGIKLRSLFLQPVTLPPSLTLLR